MRKNRRRGIALHTAPGETPGPPTTGPFFAASYFGPSYFGGSAPTAIPTDPPTFAPRLPLFRVVSQQSPVY